MVPNALLAGASLCPGWLWVVRQVRGTGTRIMDCALAKANTSITKSDQWWPMASWEITRNSTNPWFQLQTHRIKFPRLPDHIEEARAQLFWKGSRKVSRKAAPLLLRGMRYTRAASWKTTVGSVIVTMLAPESGRTTPIDGPAWQSSKRSQKTSNSTVRFYWQDVNGCDR